MKARIRYTDKLSGSLDPPSSKNYTTRYLLAAALAEGESVKVKDGMIFNVSFTDKS